MSVREEAFLFECGGEELVGLIAAPEGRTSRTGVLVIVGGPQYRAGSHRQFVLLSRHLAGSGIPCMRFDYRGMGDAMGTERDFEAVDQDVRAAIDAFFARQPRLERVVLWGLCDGASAACFYAATDIRVAGLVLLNPWVRTEGGAAKTYLKHYYMRRLLDRGFWKKLLTGRVSVGASVGGVLRSAAAATGAGRTDIDGGQRPLPERILNGLIAGGKPSMIVLSGRDFVAREFEGVLTESSGWSRLLAQPYLDIIRIDDADHTFSSATLRNQVASATGAWIWNRLSNRPAEPLGRDRRRIWRG